MTHTVLIVLHATAGTVAFGGGLLALRRPRWFGVYYAAMLVMAVSVAGAVGVGWAGLSPVTRWVFLGLLVLAAVMLARAELARRLFPAGYRSPAAVEHVGFTLVGLADAFVVVTLLNLGWPEPLVVAVAVAVAVAGHLLIGRARRHRATGLPDPVGRAGGPATPVRRAAGV